MFSEGVERDQWRDQWNKSGLMHLLLQVSCFLVHSWQSTNTCYSRLIQGFFVSQKPSKNIQKLIIIINEKSQ